MVWSICTNSFRTLTCWFYPDANKSFTIFDMQKEQIEDHIGQGTLEDLVNLYLELFNSPDHSLEEKTRVFKIFEEGQYHFAAAKVLLHTNKHTFALLVFVSSTERLRDFFGEIALDKDLESYVKIFELLMSFSSMDYSTVDPKKVCWKVAHNLPKNIYENFHTILGNKTDPEALGFLISAGNLPALSKNLLVRFVLNNPCKRVITLFQGITDGWDDYSITPSALTLIFTDETFAYWTKSMFLENFFSFSTETQAAAITSLSASRRTLFLKKGKENLVQLAKILEEIFSSSIKFEEKIDLCSAILRSLSNEKLESLIEELTKLKSFALPYILASLSPVRMELLNVSTFLKKTSFHKFDPEEIERFIGRFQNSPLRMENISEFTATLEVHDEDHSIDVDLNLREVGEHGELLPLKNPNITATEEAFINDFVKEIPNVFLFIAGFSNEESQKVYMRFLPYLNVSQIKEFACGLKFVDMKSGVGLLQKYSQRLTIEKSLALLRYLPPPILNAWLKNSDSHLKKAVSSFQHEVTYFTQQMENFKKQNNDRESRQYKIDYEEFQQRHQVLLNNGREYTSALYHALQKFQTHCQLTIAANKRPLYLASIVISLGQITEISRSLTSQTGVSLNFLQTCRPLNKRRREEPIGEDLIMGVGVLKGITPTIAVDMGITIESLKAVGIHSQNDLFDLGLTEKNSHRHEQLLRTYLSQPKLESCWNSLADNKIWSISSVKEIAQKSDELFSLSKIVKRLKEGAHG